MKTSGLQYVLVTPARNEEDFIELTIQSVVRQTVRPLRWAIVSDGSTDRTDEIVGQYVAQHDWIELVRMPERQERHFAGKVGCFNAGFARVQHLPYDLVGSLDADISFDADYFSFLLSKFQLFPELGVGGTPFVEGNKSYDYRFTNIEHVSGACQLFRRQCFAEIGGYTPIRGGGIDWTAVTTARMKGWKTRTFTDKVCHHHRIMGTGNGSQLGASYRHGRKDYCLGYHPVWETLRGCFQMTNKPYVLGGLMLLVGYWLAMLRRLERPIPDALIRFHRQEQMQRLRALCKRICYLGN